MCDFTGVVNLVAQEDMLSPTERFEGDISGPVVPVVECQTTGGETRAAGEGFIFHPALIGSDVRTLGLRQDLEETHIGAIRKELMKSVLGRPGLNIDALGLMDFENQVGNAGVDVKSAVILI